MSSIAATSTATFLKPKKQNGITKLYNEYFHEPTSQLYKLHAKLDQLVLQAYGFNPTDDLLEKLLTLNLELAEKEKIRRGDGLRPGFAHGGALGTALRDLDC